MYIHKLLLRGSKKTHKKCFDYFISIYLITKIIISKFGWNDGYDFLKRRINILIILEYVVTKMYVMEKKKIGIAYIFILGLVYALRYI